MERMTRVQRLERDISGLRQSLSAANIEGRDFLLTKDESHIEGFHEQIKSLRDGLEGGKRIQGDDVTAVLSALTEFENLVDRLRTNEQKRRDLSAAMSNAYAQLEETCKQDISEPIEQERNTAAMFGNDISPVVAELLASSNRFQMIFMEGQIRGLEHLYFKDNEALAAYDESFKKKEACLVDLQRMVEVIKGEPDGKDYSAAVARLKELAATNRALMAQMFDLSRNDMNEVSTMTAKGQQLVGDIDKISEKLGNEVANLKRRTELSVGILTVCGLVFGILLAWLITRSVTKPLNRLISLLTNSSEQVISSSSQMAASSQSLAEGASEQAAALEETSSSMEELSAMTRQNADNSQEANILMRDTSSVVEAADESMQRLIASMREITDASEQTSRIVKTIDEIAFQTNLLALNAAVEAARAGEAGAGFAVVADEVRTLALRAAGASKNTASLIEDTTRKVEEGSMLVETTNNTFGQVAESSKKVGELVAEIAAASREQADGIAEMNKAITEMDRIVQSNAAQAEESASAAEEMDRQSEQLNEMLATLRALVNGDGIGRGANDKTRSQAMLPADPIESAQWKGVELKGNGDRSSSNLEGRLD